MTVREHIERFNRSLNPKPVLSKEEIESIRDSVSDPTGLQPFMKNASSKVRICKSRSSNCKQLSKSRYDLRKKSVPFA